MRSHDGIPAGLPPPHVYGYPHFPPLRVYLVLSFVLLTQKALPPLHGRLSLFQLKPSRREEKAAPHACTARSCGAIPASVCRRPASCAKRWLVAEEDSLSAPIRLELSLSQLNPSRREGKAHLTRAIPASVCRRPASCAKCWLVAEEAPPPAPIRLELDCGRTRAAPDRATRFTFHVARTALEEAAIGTVPVPISNVPIAGVPTRWRRDPLWPVPAPVPSRDGVRSSAFHNAC